MDGGGFSYTPDKSGGQQLSAPRAPRNATTWSTAVTAVALAVASGVFTFGVLALLDHRDLNDVVGAVTSTEPREFYSVEGRFRADFAGQPGMLTEELRIPGHTVDMTVYTVERGHHLIQAVGLYPDTVDEFALEGAVNGMAAALGGRVLDASATTVQGHEALRFTVEAGDGVELRGVFVRTPGRVYHVMAGGDSPEATQHFIDSFEILPTDRAAVTGDT